MNFNLQFNNIVSNMTGIYGSGKMCPYETQNCDLTLEPGISLVIDNPTLHSWKELQYYW